MGDEPPGPPGYPGPPGSPGPPEPPGPSGDGDRPLRGLPGGRSRPKGGTRPAQDPPGDGRRNAQRPKRPLQVLPGGERRLRSLPDRNAPPLKVLPGGDGAAPAPEDGQGPRGRPGRRPPGRLRVPGRVRRRRVLGVAAALALLVGVALTGRVVSGVPAAGERPSRPAPTTAPAPSTTLPSPSPVVATIPTGGFPYGMAFGAGALWVAGGDAVRRVDPDGNRVVATIPVGTTGSGQSGMGPSGVAVGAGAVWAPVAVPGALWQIDPASDKVVGRIPLGGPLREPISVSAAHGSVWVASRGDGEAGVLFRVDPGRRRVVAEVPLDGVPTAMAATHAAVWVVTDSGRALVVDPRRNRVAHSVNPGGGPLLGFGETVAAGAGGVWLAEPFAEQVAHIDPSTRRVVARIPAGAATAVAVGQGAVWVASSDGLLRIDPANQRVHVAVPPSELRLTLLVATGAGAVWAAGWNSVARIDPARVGP
jgi:hypothetical protein